MLLQSQWEELVEILTKFFWNWKFFHSKMIFKYFIGVQIEWNNLQHELKSSWIIVPLENGVIILWFKGLFNFSNIHIQDLFINWLLKVHI